MSKILNIRTIVATICLASACTSQSIDRDVVHKDTVSDGETIDVTVSARLDVSFKAKALLEDPDTAPQLSALWTWTNESRPELHFDNAGVPGISIASSCTPDAADGSLATFTFKGIPAEAKVTDMVYGTAGACGQVVSSKKDIDASSLWMAAEITAEAGTASISGHIPGGIYYSASFNIDGSTEGTTNTEIDLKPYGTGLGTGDHFNDGGSI